MIVYLIFKNSDMTEGRGPMVLSKIMHDQCEAIAFALQQPGVMGIKGRQNTCNKKVSYYVPGTLLVEGDWEVLETHTQ